LDEREGGDVGEVPLECLEQSELHVLDGGRPEQLIDKDEHLVRWWIKVQIK
jgi:hypothetical protein